jgi:hypothetical protein
MKYNEFHFELSIGSNQLKNSFPPNGTQYIRRGVFRNEHTNKDSGIKNNPHELPQPLD